MSETSGTKTSGPIADRISPVEKGAQSLASFPLSKPRAAAGSCAAVQFTGTNDR